MTHEPRGKRLLASPKLPALVAFVAFLLCSPALGAGLATEDWVQRAVAQTAPTGKLWNLFDSLRTPADVAVARSAGTAPWLTPPNLSLSFLRPLSSLWLAFDYRVLDDAAFVMHLESLALFVAAIVLAARLYRRFAAEPWVAGLATLVFALDDAHGVLVGWLAARSALLCLVLGLGALALHDRARRDGSRKAAIGGYLLLAASLAASELGLGVLGYFVAHALYLDTRPGRWRALAPALGVGGAFVVLHRALGYGARGSGLYLDPLGSPGVLSREVPARLGALLLTELGHTPYELWLELRATERLAFGLGGVALLGVLALVFLRGDPDADSVRLFRFSVAGLLLALVPAIGTFPTDRTLALAGFGGSLAVALVVARAFARPSVLARAAALALAALHLLLAPVLLPVKALHMVRYHERVARGVASAYVNVVSGDDVVVALNAPDYYFCGLLRSVRHHTERGPAPPLLCLGTGQRVDVRRVDENSIEVRTPAGFLRYGLNELYRSRQNPLAAGTRVETQNVEVEVTSVSESGDPVAATFRFNWPLSSERLRMLAYVGDTFVPVAPPKDGEHIEVSASGVTRNP